MKDDAPTRKVAPVSLGERPVPATTPAPFGSAPLTVTHTITGLDEDPTRVDASSVKSLVVHVAGLARERERLSAAAERLELGAVEGAEAHALARVLRDVVARLDALVESQGP